MAAAEEVTTRLGEGQEGLQQSMTSSKCLFIFALSQPEPFSSSCLLYFWVFCVNCASFAAFWGMLCLAQHISASLPTAVLFVTLLWLWFDHLIWHFLLNFLLTNLKTHTPHLPLCFLHLLQQAFTCRGQHEIPKAWFFNFFCYPQYVFPWRLVLTVLCGFLFKFACKKKPQKTNLCWLNIDEWKIKS